MDRTATGSVAGSDDGPPPPPGADTARDIVREYAPLFVNAVANVGKVKWLVDRLLPTPGTSLVVGPPKGGKSVLARNLVAAVTKQSRKHSRATFLDRHVRGARTVLLSMEDSLATVKAHFGQLGMEDPEGKVRLGGHQLPEPDRRMDFLEAVIQDHLATLVVVDILSKFVLVEDGNNYTSVYRAMAPFTDLAHRYECHIMLLHHASKHGGRGGQEALGSQAYLGSADGYLSVKVADDGQTRTIEGQGRNDVALRRTELAYQAGVVSLGKVMEGQTTEEIINEVLKVLEAEGPCTPYQLRDAVGVKQNVMAATLTKLRKEGYVTRTGAGKKGSPFWFSLPD